MIKHLLWLLLTAIILALFGGPLIVLSLTKELKPITKMILTIIIIIMGTIRIITLI